MVSFVLFLSYCGFWFEAADSILMSYMSMNEVRFVSLMIMLAPSVISIPVSHFMCFYCFASTSNVSPISDTYSLLILY